MNDVIEDISDIEPSAGPTTDKQRETIINLCREQVKHERIVARLKVVPSETEASRIERLATAAKSVFITTSDRNKAWQNVIRILDTHIAKESLRTIQEVKLPAAMLDAGVTREDLTNGASVALRVDYHTNQLTTEEGFNYLISQKAGSLIKHDINMQFGREQADLVKRILKRIAGWKSSSNFKLTEKRAVNAQTLRGWVNEQIRNGVDLPFDVLGIYARKYTVVNLPENNKLG